MVNILEYGFDILVTQGLDVKDESYFDSLFPRADRLMGTVGLDKGAWFGWEDITASRMTGTASSQTIDHPFMKAFSRAWYFPLAMNTRTSHWQSAADLGLKSFWEKQGFMLIERGHVLLVNDHAQFQVVFHFKLRKEIAGDECHADDAAKDVSSVLIDICRQRSIYENLGQQEYANKVIHDAVCEVDRSCATLLDGVDRAVGETGRNASVISHAAFPWIFCGFVDPSITTIFGSQEDEAIESFSASAEASTSSVRYVGWNYAVFREGTPQPKTTWQLAPLCSYMQYSYIQMRKVQNYALTTMGRLIQHDRNVDLEDEFLRFERISLGYERYVLDYNRYVGSRIPSHGAIAEDVEKRWELRDSIEQLKQSVSFDRDFLASRFQHNLHRDSRRQNGILAAIAIVQLLTLVGVVADYSSLKPGIQSFLDTQGNNSTNLNALERLFFSNVSELLIVLVVMSLILVLLVYTKPAIGAVRLVVNRFLISLKRTHAKLSTRIGRAKNSRKYQVKRSPIHGVGYFTKRQLKRGHVILDISAGERMSESSYLKSSFTLCEWNAVSPGELYVRSEPTDYRFINHSREPNASVSLDISGSRVRVTALQDITAGEEIILDYRDEPLSNQYIVESGGYL